MIQKGAREGSVLRKFIDLRDKGFNWLRIRDSNLQHIFFIFNTLLNWLPPRDSVSLKRNEIALDITSVPTDVPHKNLIPSSCISM